MMNSLSLSHIVLQDSSILLNYRIVMKDKTDHYGGELDELNEYYHLLRVDPQVKYACNAVRRYKASHSNDVDDDRKSGHKRNIITVDDNLKINYEMVKTTPGNFIESSPSTSTKNKVAKEQMNKIAKMKTNYYKKRLYTMNEQFLSKQGKLEEEGEKNEENVKDSEVTDETDLAEKYKWHLEINRDLLKEYKSLLQEEKRWFLKKELMLDANIKFDLFSTRDEDQTTVLFGSKDASSVCVFK